MRLSMRLLALFILAITSAALAWVLLGPGKLPGADPTPAPDPATHNRTDLDHALPLAEEAAGIDSESAGDQDVHSRSSSPLDVSQYASQMLTQAARASSARELDELAQFAKSAGKDDLARKLELIEEQACGPLIQGEVGDHISPDNVGWIQWEQFCKDSTIDPLGDHHAAALEFLDLIQDLVVEKSSRLLSLLDQMSPEEAFLRLIAESGNPVDIEAVALLYSNGYIDLDLLSYFEILRQQVNVQKLYDVQHLALDLYSCERFGHCGPRSFQTIGACLLVPECQAGNSYLDLMAYLTSPRDWERALLLLEHIRRWEHEPRP